MSSGQSNTQSQPTSSSDTGSAGLNHPATGLDQRKRKRMQSNRESARRSRARKQQHLDGLLAQVSQLTAENARIAAQIDAVMQQYSTVESGNVVMRTQLVELTDRLRSVSSVLRFVQEFSGVAMDIPEIPEPVLEPWRMMPCPASQAVLATSAQLML